MPNSSSVELGVLGPTILLAEGQEIGLRPRERALLAALALGRRPQTADELAEVMWAGRPPATARKSVQNHVARVRRAAAAPVIGTTHSGYVLDRGIRIDAEALEQATASVQAAARPSAAAAIASEALDRWRGLPFADLPESIAVATARRHLDTVRRDLEDHWAEAALWTGDDANAARAAERLVAEDPYRERRWWLLALGRYRAGRRRDSLAALQEARVRLAEVGLELGDDLQRLETLIATDDPVLLTGEAVGRLRVDRVAPGRAAAEPFVGRGDELGRLHAAHGRTTGATSGQLVWVIGPAGIGKTALTSAFARELEVEGLRVVSVRCDPAAPVPLAPFGQLVDELLADLPPDAPVDRRALEAIRGQHAGPGPGSGAARLGGRQRLFDAVRGVVEVAAEHRPGLVLVFQDADRSPPTTRHLVRHVVEGAPILAIATARAVSDDELASLARTAGEPADTIELSPLSREDINEYLVQRLGEGEDEGDAAGWLLNQTGGNPLFLRELAGDLLDRHAIRAVDGRWILDRPPRPLPGLAEVVRSHIAALPQDVLETLQVAAVFGIRFDPADVGEVAGSQYRQLTEARRAGLVVTDALSDQLAFAHELIHRTVYDTLPEGTRVELHDEAAAVIGARPVTTRRIVELAHHDLVAAPLDPQRAISSAQRAGEEALAAFAFAEAADWYRRALDVAETAASPETVAELRIQLGDALLASAEPTGRDEVLSGMRAAEALGDPELVARAALALCRVGPVAATAADPVGVTVAERVLPEVRDPAARAELAAAACMTAALHGDSARSRALYEIAEGAARAAGRRDLLALVLRCAYLPLSPPRFHDRQLAIGDELLALGEELDSAATEWEGHHLHYAVRLQRGDPAVFDAYDRMAELSGAAGGPGRRWELWYPNRHWELRNMAAALDHLRGDLEGAERRILDASMDAEGVAPGRVRAVTGAQLFAIRLDQGRVGELAPVVAGLVRDVPEWAGWLAAHALAAAAAGDLDAAAAAFDRLAADGFRAVPDDATYTAALSCLARASALIGDPDRAARAVAVLAPWSGCFSWTATCTFGPVDLALGLAARVAGDVPGAVRHLGRVVEQAGRVGAVGYAAQARAELDDIGA